MASTSTDRRWRETLTGGALVAAALAAALAGPIASGERFYFRDLSQNHGPLLAGARTLVLSGEPLWWNPWAGGGEPFLANPNHLLLVPSGLLALVLPPGIGLDASIIAGWLLAALALLALLRLEGASGWAAATGSLVFGLSGFLLSAGTLPNLLAAACWIPAALWCLRRAARSRAWLPAAVLTSAFVFAPCEPSSALVLIVFAFVPLRRAVTGNHEKTLAGPGQAPQDRAAVTRSAEAPATALALLLGMCAAAVQILPALHWIAASARGAGLAPSETGKWCLNPWRLPELIAPGFLGDPSRIDKWWSAGLFETGYPLVLSLYVGAPALLLSLWGASRLLGAARRRSQAARRLGARLSVLAVPLSGAAFFLLALGLLNPLMGLVPGGGWFRYPEKFLLGTMLALAILAAAGARDLLQRSSRVLAAPRQGEAPRGGSPAASAPRRLISTAVIVTGVLLAAGILAAPAILNWWFPPSGSAGLVRESALSGIRSSLHLGAAATGAFAVTLMLLGWFRPAVRGAVLAGAVALSILIGALAPGRGAVPWRLRANPSAPREYFAGDPFFAPQLDRLRQSGERLFRFERPSGFAGRSRSGTMADLFAWERRSLTRSSASEFGVELAFDRSTDRVDPQGAEEALRFFTGRPVEDQSRFWSVASARLVLSYGPLESEGLKIVGEVAGESNIPLLLYENLQVLSRARVVGDVQLVRSDGEAFRAIASAPGERWRTTAWLLDGPAGGMARDPGEGVAVPPSARHHGIEPAEAAPEWSVTLLKSRAGRFHYAVQATDDVPSPASRSAWLVVAENDVPGWRATIDGRPAPIVRANGMHLAVPLPDGGSHRVELAYFPPGLIRGAMVSLLAIALAIFLAAFQGRKQCPERG